MDECVNCGAAPANLIPVWEEMDKYEAEQEPRYVGCTRCHTMVDTRLFKDRDEERPSQAELTSYERRTLAAKDAVGNQNNDLLTIIEWQVVKGAALEYGVRDWLSKADPNLTLGENLGLMERYGTRSNDTTLRDSRAPEVDRNV
jgi:hypothetical protein